MLTNATILFLVVYVSNPSTFNLPSTVSRYLIINFVAHFENLQSRALKRLNLIKIFSHKSWKLCKWTLKSIYRSLVGSIFEYSFFCVANISAQTIFRAQSIQNRAIRCIYKRPWDSPNSGQSVLLSGIEPIKQRLIQLGCK